MNFDSNTNDGRGAGYSFDRFRSFHTSPSGRTPRSHIMYTSHRPTTILVSCIGGWRLGYAYPYARMYSNLFDVPLYYLLSSILPRTFLTVEEQYRMKCQKSVQLNSSEGCVKEVKHKQQTD